MKTTNPTTTVQAQPENSAITKSAHDKMPGDDQINCACDEFNRLVDLVDAHREAVTKANNNAQRLADALKGMLYAFAYKAEETVANVRAAREALAEWSKSI